MKKQMKQDLRNLNDTQLKGLVDDTRKEIFLLRMKQTSSHETNTALSKNLRKKLAYVLTLMNQRES